MELTIRRARTSDVRAMRRLLDVYTRGGILLDKPTVTLYEDVQEFWVAERPAPDGGDGGSSGEVVACGALHVIWEDLAEVRTLAVDPSCRGTGTGHRLLTALLDTARALGIGRIFCLTFEVEFFSRHGFVEIGEMAVEPGILDELMRSADEGVAEFLDLEHVKPNTLGNTRMLLQL
jgi:amino-acid N-acetyltransferase